MRLGLTAILLTTTLTGCGPLLPELEPQGAGFSPGTYEMCLEVELTPTQEEATRRCNFGAPGGDLHACTFIYADPPLIVAPVPRHVNDWERKTILGHELLHVPFGNYHR